MSLVRFNNVSRFFNRRPVLRQVYFHLDKGDRVGLIGKNGVGKTTALRLILGRDDPDEGTVDVQAGLTIGYFSQFSELSDSASINNILEDLFSDIQRIQKELSIIEEEMHRASAGRHVDGLVKRQSSLYDQMEQLGGWMYQNRIDTVLTKLGFSAADRRKPVGQLSGGWRNRAALAKILLDAPGIFLMDEPTNFLDIEGLAWLEKWLQQIQGALIVVSHDRHFLDNVVNRIVEIENHDFQEYRGGFTQYVREKKLRLKTLERQFVFEKELLAFEEEAIADRRAAAKNPTDALKKKLAKVKRQIEPKPTDKIITRIYDGLRIGNKLCTVENTSKAYPNHMLFGELSFMIHRGDRIAVIGPNGCGKTTLLSVLTGDPAPDTGSVTWHGDGLCLLQSDPGGAGRQGHRFPLGQHRRDGIRCTPQACEPFPVSPAIL